MKAICTKYFGPGNVRGSRIKAYEMDGKSVTVSYNYALNPNENHRLAAELLAAKMNWSGRLIQGSIKDAEVFVFEE